MTSSLKATVSTAPVARSASERAARSAASSVARAYTVKFAGSSLKVRSKTAGVTKA